MPKRGERLPWSVSYRWADYGTRGRKAFRTEADAQLFAAELRGYALTVGREIDVDVIRRD